MKEGKKTREGGEYKRKKMKETKAKREDEN